jgi:solute carrier family 25 thiamine pyrophosphate transporter 19
LELHAQVYRGMVDAARGVYRQQGIRGLYSGLGITLLEIMPYAALQFGLYDLFTAAAEKARVGTPAEKVRNCRICRTSARDCGKIAPGTSASQGKRL